MLKPFGVAIGAAAIVIALVVAANIWPRRSNVAAPSADTAVLRSSSPFAALTPSAATIATRPNPDLIRHSWQRPYSITPGMDRWGSGFLSVAGDVLEYGREPGAAASRSEFAVAGLDSLVVTATLETQECSAGDVGEYRWSVEGSDTVLTLTAIGSDACGARERALAGTWVRIVPGA